MPDLVLLDVRDGVATITLNNPDKLNAFTGDMREHMGAALDQVAADPSVRVLMITGAGRAFCAGGDVKHMVGLKQRGTGFEAMLPLLEAGRATVLRIDALPFPTIAAVNGPAAGGGMSLALACDLRIASDQATFCEAFTRIGLHVDWGGSYFLPRMVGLAKSLELCWLADVVDAGEALRVGLVNRVVPHAAFRDEVQALAARLAAAPQTSLRWTTRTLRAGCERGLAECIEAEIEGQAACWESPDSGEGIRAFIEKRTPVFGAAVTAAEGRGGRTFE